MTAAKRSLKLIREMATADLDTLGNGVVPEGSFTASVTTYEKALTVLRTLDALGEAPLPPGKGWLATVEVARDDLDLLITLLRQSDMAGVIRQAEDGSPIGKLLAAVEGEPEGN
jgi:hypothetical protein